LHLTEDEPVDFNFAFQPGGLDRAAPLRLDASVRANPEARTNVFWRGKLLVNAEDRPARVGLEHPALSDCREPPAFIGLADGVPLFAADLSLWQPHEDAAVIGQFTDTTSQIHPGFADCRLAEIRGMMPGLTLLEGEAIATGRALLGWHATHRFCANCGTPSTPEASGWHRKCSSCGTQHFPRTDPVVIMAITRGDRLLLGRGPSWPERMYSLLAGFVEPGETIENAVRRETFEETGIGVGKVDYVACQPWPFPMSLMFGCIGEALDEAITLDPVELGDARWLSRDEVKVVLRGEHPELAAPRSGAIAGGLIAAWAEERIG
jgi:NAD+ diphosphatase